MRVRLDDSTSSPDASQPMEEPRLDIYDGCFIAFWVSRIAGGTRNGIVVKDVEIDRSTIRKGGEGGGLAAGGCGWARNERSRWVVQ